MASLNNIEKLIQMATIEHMYEMLQKLKNDISYNELKNDISCNEGINNIFDESLKKNDSTIFDNGFCSNELLVSQINELKDINKNISYETEILTRTIESLVNKVISLENEMKELKEQFQNTHQNKQINCLDTDSKEKEERIKLKIEEKNIIYDSDNLTNNYETLVEEEEQEEEEEEEEEQEEVVQEEKVVQEEEEELVEEEEQEQVKEEEEEAVVQEDGDVEEEEEEEEEEEVATDEEEEVNVKKEECLEEKESEEEEVFEIEIDDVTYFTTDEDNGILYEVDSDGEVGKKVGIIKNGEPIFS
jgi:hypothetical protein